MFGIMYRLRQSNLCVLLFLYALIVNSKVKGK